MSLRAIWNEIDRQSEEETKRDKLRSSSEDEPKKKKKKKPRRRSYSSSDDSKYTYDSYTHSSRSYSEESDSSYERRKKKKKKKGKKSKRKNGEDESSDEERRAKVMQEHMEYQKKIGGVLFNGKPFVQPLSTEGPQPPPNHNQNQNHRGRFPNRGGMHSRGRQKKWTVFNNKGGVIQQDNNQSGLLGDEGPGPANRNYHNVGDQDFLSLHDPEDNAEFNGQNFNQRGRGNSRGGFRGNGGFRQRHGFEQRGRGGGRAGFQNRGNRDNFDGEFGGYGAEYEDDEEIAMGRAARGEGSVRPRSNGFVMSTAEPIDMNGFDQDQFSPRQRNPRPNVHTENLPPPMPGHARRNSGSSQNRHEDYENDPDLERTDFPRSARQFHNHDDRFYDAAEGAPSPEPSKGLKSDRPMVKREADSFVVSNAKPLLKSRKHGNQANRQGREQMSGGGGHDRGQQRNEQFSNGNRERRRNDSFSPNRRENNKQRKAARQRKKSEEKSQEETVAEVAAKAAMEAAASLTNTSYIQQLSQQIAAQYSAPSYPTMPTIPGFGIPGMPGMPMVPTMPTMPAALTAPVMPTLPTIPAMPVIAPQINVMPDIQKIAQQQAAVFQKKLEQDLQSQINASMSGYYQPPT